MLWAVLFGYGKKKLLQVRVFRAVPGGGGGTQRRDARGLAWMQGWMMAVRTYGSSTQPAPTFTFFSLLNRDMTKRQ